MDQDRFPNQAVAEQNAIAMPDRDVVPAGDTVWYDFDAMPDRFISIPYIVLINANSKIEGAKNHVGEFYMSGGVGFIDGDLRIIPVAIGSRPEFRVIDRNAGEIATEEAIQLRGVLLSEAESTGGLPFVMNFRRKSKDAVKDMIATMKIKRLRPSEVVFSLGAAEYTNAKNQSWMIPTLTFERSAPEALATVEVVWGGIAADAPMDDDSGVSGVSSDPDF